MAKIFISSPRLKRESDYEIFNLMKLSLLDKGHEIISDEFNSSFNFNNNKIDNRFNELLFDAEIIIAIITESLVETKSGFNEMTRLRNYASHTDNKLFIPILSSGIKLDYLPESYSALSAIRLENDSKIEIERVSNRINEYINIFLGKKLANEEKSKFIKENIESSAPTYISETIKELEKRESYQRTVSIVWYIVGFLSIVIGVAVAIWLTTSGIVLNNEKENWSLTIFYSIKSMFIIILLITASKYCFNLAKSYMSESLKIADRIHAISFGKFYLKIFKNNLNPNDIKDIFRDWNINNQENNFSNLSTDDYDPKILEKAIQVIDKIKGTE
ncbi:hypothetical protein F6A46_12565 [Tenacibaculum finnmarkense genomovar ulcerans]|uniref:hypothetical protein n=1 Tax=Tenacibaculum finnmarkense TaxID=2781243 RepID=UPI00187BC472|nr:hypothetical protein [Tenacibaculum finnmarkense]MBE7689054.1 hypothetical protein [Tenacibaculum finnmarkense genomovar ulcerans]